MCVTRKCCKKVNPKKSVTKIISVSNTFSMQFHPGINKSIQENWSFNQITLSSWFTKQYLFCFPKHTYLSQSWNLDTACFLSLIPKVKIYQYHIHLIKSLLYVWITNLQVFGRRKINSARKALSTTGWRKFCAQTSNI